MEWIIGSQLIIVRQTSRSQDLVGLWLRDPVGQDIYAYGHENKNIKSANKLGAISQQKTK